MHITKTVFLLLSLGTIAPTRAELSSATLWIAGIGIAIFEFSRFVENLIEREKKECFANINPQGAAQKILEKSTNIKKYHAPLFIMDAFINDIEYLLKTREDVSLAVTHNTRSRLNSELKDWQKSRAYKLKLEHELIKFDRQFSPQFNAE